MMTFSRTHFVLIPSYNSGPLVLETVRSARACWNPVWVVVDGSTDGTAAQLQAMAASDSGLRVLVLPRNQGKGAAVLHGLEAAAAEGFTHALAMDADGQHPPDSIQHFMALSAAEPEALILGEPIFGPEAPLVRVRGRRLSNACANVETLWHGIGDSLFGFRVYPVEPLIEIMRASRWMRRYDFDAEAAVRLCWKGVPARNVRVPVRYLRADEGGVSHFRYGRDNVVLSWMHLRLGAGFLLRLPMLLLRKARPAPGGREELTPR
ncbi:glycosyltransferase family 2 protein [Roseomonas aerophila]|uniref:Glycosyltransferase family 2 protein n=1 Tax=Teichococcus aerophilus TaxID=1224513 RepID=A0ABR7RGR4_9PROT|nr:glycosyltransferase family 2 protein [Pseudoroseomonas aerophila]MBC9205513.1 glycosyltransferase family 2 protein [Pseudoroseomonas aerophila]